MKSFKWIGLISRNICHFHIKVRQTAGSFIFAVWFIEMNGCSVINMVSALVKQWYSPLKPLCELETSSSLLLL